MVYRRFCVCFVPIDLIISIEICLERQEEKLKVNNRDLSMVIKCAHLTLFLVVFDWISRWKWSPCLLRVLLLWHCLACLIQCRYFQFSMVIRSIYSYCIGLVTCVFSRSFEGRVVAKLPFEPIPWIRGLSHRNLSGDDFTDCSFIFLYVLCTMSIRQVGNWSPKRKKKKKR
jgi:hypothetical protein